MSSTYTLLVAEHDLATRTFLCDNLTADGYEVIDAESSAQALEKFKRNPVDAVIADVNGDTLALIDAVAPYAGVIVLCGQADELDAVRKLDHGADDVVHKPFSYPELRARVQALLRRSGGRPAPRSMVKVGPLTFDNSARRVTVDGVSLDLSQKEFALLRVLISDPTRVFFKDELMQTVWGKVSNTSRTLDSHACRLRGKLQEAAVGSKFVINVWGVGYRLVDTLSVEAVAA